MKESDNVDPVETVQVQGDNLTTKIKPESYNEFFIGIATVSILICLIPLSVYLVLFAYDPVRFFISTNLFIFFAFFTLVAVFLIWLLPKFQLLRLGKKIQVPSNFESWKEHISLEDDLRKTVTHVIGGFLILIGFFFTYNSFELTRKSQNSERLLKSLEQLKNNEIKNSAKVGAIFSLEKIADDYQSDTNTVIRILSAYILENSPKTVEDKIASPDIEAAVEVITRLNRDPNNERDSIDLSQINLRKVDLSNANFSGIDLSHSNLRESDLRAANLRTANINETDLTQANLNGARFACDFYEGKIVGANFSNAIFECENDKASSTRSTKFADTELLGVIIQKRVLINSKFEKVNLKGVSFNKSDLTASNWHNVSITDSDLSELDLRRSRLLSVAISASSLASANLTNISFMGGSLNKVQLNNARLNNAVLQDVTMSEVMLTNADLRGADLSKTTGLNFDLLKVAFIDSKTKLPSDLDKIRQELYRQTVSNLNAYVNQLSVDQRIALEFKSYYVIGDLMVKENSKIENNNPFGGK